MSLESRGLIALRGLCAAGVGTPILMLFLVGCGQQSSGTETGPSPTAENATATPSASERSGGNDSTDSPSPAHSLPVATAAATDKLVLTFDDVPALMCGAGLTDDWFENDPPLPSMDDRPLRDGYSDRGIRFRGPSEHEGATVVSPVCGGSDVEIGATSGSHALELNDHNVAKPPETIWLDRLYGSVSLVFWATDSLRVSVEAYRGSQQVASTVTAPGTWEYVGVILRGDQVGFDRVVLDLVRNEDWEWLDLPTCPVPSPLPCRDERSGRPLLAGYLVLDDLTFWPLGESPVVPE